VNVLMALLRVRLLVRHVAPVPVEELSRELLYLRDLLYGMRPHVRVAGWWRTPIFVVLCRGRRCMRRWRVRLIVGTGGRV
jgi:hypothetical protein